MNIDAKLADVPAEWVPWILTGGYLDWRRLPDGRFAGVVPLTFGRAQVVVSPAEPSFYKDQW